MFHVLPITENDKGYYTDAAFVFMASTTASYGRYLHSASEVAGDLAQIAALALIVTRYIIVVRDQRNRADDDEIPDRGSARQALNRLAVSAFLIGSISSLCALFWPTKKRNASVMPLAMTTSPNGRKAIEKEEGYEKKLRDGRCKSYRERLNGKLDVWTCGYGCTEGVTADTIWTADEADEALSRELVKHEAAVLHMVSVPLNQNEFDALVSLAYNCGDSAEMHSRIIKLLNAGDREGAAKAFGDFIYFNHRPLQDLIDRRAREAKLFLTPVIPPYTQTKQARGGIAAVIGAGTTAVATGASVVAASDPTPPPPPTVADTVQTISQPLSDLAQYCKWAGIAASMLTLAGALYMLWHSYKAHHEQAA